MDTIFRNGDSGPAVTQIVDLLAGVGLLDPADLPASYDDRVENAVRAFKSVGSTAPEQVAGQVEFWKRTLG